MMHVQANIKVDIRSILFFRKYTIFLDKSATYYYLILDPATLCITMEHNQLHLKELEILRIMIFLIVSKPTIILLLSSRKKKALNNRDSTLIQ